MSKARTIAGGGSITPDSKFSGARELLATARGRLITGIC